MASPGVPIAVTLQAPLVKDVVIRVPKLERATDQQTWVRKHVADQYLYGQSTDEFVIRSARLLGEVEASDGSAIHRVLIARRRSLETLLNTIREAGGHIVYAGSPVCALTRSHDLDASTTGVQFASVEIKSDRVYVAQMNEQGAMNISTFCRPPDTPTLLERLRTEISPSPASHRSNTSTVRGQGTSSYEPPTVPTLLTGPAGIDILHDCVGSNEEPSNEQPPKTFQHAHLKLGFGDGIYRPSYRDSARMGGSQHREDERPENRATSEIQEGVDATSDKTHSEEKGLQAITDASGATEPSEAGREGSSIEIIQSCETLPASFGGAVGIALAGLADASNPINLVSSEDRLKAQEHCARSDTVQVGLIVGGLLVFLFAGIWAGETALNEYAHAQTAQNTATTTASHQLATEREELEALRSRLKETLHLQSGGTRVGVVLHHVAVSIPEHIVVRDLVISQLSEEDADRYATTYRDGQGAIRGRVNPDPTVNTTDSTQRARIALRGFASSQVQVIDLLRRLRSDRVASRLNIEYVRKLGSDERSRLDGSLRKTLRRAGLMNGSDAVYAFNLRGAVPIAKNTLLPELQGLEHTPTGVKIDDTHAAGPRATSRTDGIP
jgi:uncharacterized membrane protein YiaA